MILFRSSRPAPLAPEEVSAAIAALHAEVDGIARPLEAAHRERLRCARGCYQCCRDDLTIFEVEAQIIRERAPSLLAEGAPHPPGMCAMLAPDGACRIYDHRPYVCRTQGLPLRWEEPAERGEIEELRDICPLNEAGEPVEGLDADQCFTLGPFEARLAQLQARQDGGELRRVPLRALFDDDGSQSPQAPGPTGRSSPGEETPPR